MEILKTENLTFNYKESDRKVLKNVSIGVYEGDFVLLCGPSGCGKTTLLKHLKHLIAPNGALSGEIYFDGKNINSISERELVSDIGFVFQNPESQIVCDQAFAEMAFGLENLGIETNEIRRRVAEMASFFGIEHYFESDISTLSGGQKQLLNLAAIMVMQPKILLLDEPTSMLDPISTGDFFSIINKINKELGLTIIICEHQLESLFSIVDKVCYMEDGQVIAYDLPNLVAKKMLVDESNMCKALPASARIFKELTSDYIKELDPYSIPLNIRDGRISLSYYFHKNKIDLNRLNSSIIPQDVAGKKDKVLDVKNIYFRYEKTSPDVLSDISFSAYESETLAILGGNGVGKTTLLSLLSKINKAYRGKIKYKDNPKIGYLPQNPLYVFVKDSIEEDLKFLLKSNNLSEDVLYETINKYEFFDNASEFFSSNPLDLSGGEQQKMAFLKLLLLKPKVLLLDEPSKGLDAFSKEKLADILAELKNNGLSIILVTHDVEFAASYADRCSLMFNGELISGDIPVKFFSNNHFYTTAASKISKNILRETITVDQVVDLAKKG